MTTKKLVAQLAQRTDLPRQKAADVVAALFDPSAGIIAEELKAGRDVGLQGFGRFHVEARAARRGRNPRSGQAIEIPARRVCTFTPRQGLRSSMKDMVGA